MLLLFLKWLKHLLEGHYHGREKSTANDKAAKRANIADETAYI